MKRKEGTFPGSNNTALFYQRWQPDIDPVAVVVIVHGFGDHSGRYTYLVDHLVSRGYAVVAFDHRGHGRSPGARGYIRAWSEFHADVAACLKLVAEQYPGLAVFLLGHSMGGLVAAEYALQEPAGLRGLILSAPLLAQANLPPLLYFASRVLSMIAPGFVLKAPLDPGTISRDPAEAQRYAADPLNHTTGTPRLATEVAKTMAWVQAHAADLKLPLLLYYGTNDQLVPPLGSRTFFDAVKIADKQRIEYPGGFHESHNDLQRAQVFADVERWLEKHLA